MKIFRRNAIIVTVLLFVCVAVYLNWAYNRQEEELGQMPVSLAESVSSVAGDGLSEGLYYEAPEAAAPVKTLSNEVSDYFSDARLNRQQARDSAISTLRAAAETENASQSAVDGALAEIAVMAQYAVTEAEIESMVMAKGFDTCLAFLSEDSIIVAVPAPAVGLSDSAVSRITDIVLEQTALNTQQIRIIGVK